MMGAITSFVEYAKHVSVLGQLAERSRETDREDEQMDDNKGASRSVSLV